MLGSAASAMEAQRYGLDVTGQNIANVNTPGYTRRRPLFSEVPPPDAFTAGGGVRVTGVRAERDAFIERRLWLEIPAERRESALAGALGQVEFAVGEAGHSLDQRLGEFFDSFARLADAPTSATARQEVILQGRSLASAFNDMSDRFDAAQREADAQVLSTVDAINALATRIAGINSTLSGVSPVSPQALQLKDQVRLAVEDLSKLTSVEALQRPDGGYDVAIGNGRPLVVGAHAYELSTAPRPDTGLSDVYASDGSVLTPHLTGGTIAGFLQARDALIPTYQDSLDELAYAVVDEVNTLHTAGFDSNGDAGLPFFTALGATAGAAAAMAVNPALLAAGGEALVAASASATAAGDNGAARGLAALRDSRVLAGGTATFTDAWGQLVYRVGRDVESAQDEQRNREELVRQVAFLRDAVTGVSMDEEAANLMRFQRAYEANARYFTTVNDTLSVLMQVVGG
jgi:flagellar hook-associated protein 1 FlgK